MDNNAMKFKEMLDELGSISDEILELQTKIHALHEKFWTLFTVSIDQGESR